MIEGTRTYKGRKSAPESSTTTAVTQHVQTAKTTEEARGDAVNPERRELFQQIVPGFGRGLVKILRASNLLKTELQQLLKR